MKKELTKTKNKDNSATDDKIITLLEKILTQLSELNSKTANRIDTSVFHDYTK